MKKLLFAVAAFAGVFFAASCGGNKHYPGYEEENGSYFKLLTASKETVSADTGGAIFIKIKFKTQKDSVFLDINKQTQRASFPMRIDKPKFAGDFLSMFMKLHKGDSASFFIPLDSLRKNYPKEFEFNDPKYDTMQYLGFAVKVDSIYSRTKMQELRKKQEAEQDRQIIIMQKKQAALAPLQEQAKKEEPDLKKKDKQLLTKYLAENKITAKPDADGVYFWETGTGTGEPLMPGMVVGVKYTGKYLNGTIFDANTLVEGEDPMYFRLGIDPMVQGFTNSVMKMKKGGKATFILPPKMGYNDSLTRVFDVEVVEARMQQ